MRIHQVVNPRKPIVYKVPHGFLNRPWCVLYRSPGLLTYSRPMFDTWEKALSFANFAAQKGWI